MRFAVGGHISPPERPFLFTQKQSSIDEGQYFYKEDGLSFQEKTVSCGCQMCITHREFCIHVSFSSGSCYLVCGLVSDMTQPPLQRLTVLGFFPHYFLGMSGSLCRPLLPADGVLSEPRGCRDGGVWNNVSFINTCKVPVCETPPATSVDLSVGIVLPGHCCSVSQKPF